MRGVSGGGGGGGGAHFKSLDRNRLDLGRAELIYDMVISLSISLSLVERVRPNDM